MAGQIFNQEASRGSAITELSRLEKSLRGDLISRLPIKTRENSPILGYVDQALKQTRPDLYPRIAFAAEKALPPEAANDRQVFNELLVRLTDGNGVRISPPDVFAEMEKHGLSEDFRTWLTVAQISSIAGNSETRHSVNVSPGDMASEKFVRNIGRALALSQKAGSAGLILEATEEGRWRDAPAEKLSRLALDNGASVALDDFGAREFERFDREALRAFASRLPADRMIVKLDGPVVQSFMREQNDFRIIYRLEDIQENCPEAVVVAERVGNAKELQEFRAKLSRYDIDQPITLIQDYRLDHETPVGLQASVRAVDPAGTPSRGITPA